MGKARSKQQPSEWDEQRDCMPSFPSGSSGKLNLWCEDDCQINLLLQSHWNRTKVRICFAQSLRHHATSAFKKPLGMDGIEGALGKRQLTPRSLSPLAASSFNKIVASEDAICAVEHRSVSNSLNASFAEILRNAIERAESVEHSGDSQSLCMRRAHCNMFKAVSSSPSECTTDKSAKNSEPPAEFLASHEIHPLLTKIRYRPDEIPNLIHFIWLGNSPLPTFFFKTKKSWQIKNPQLVHTLWTDAEIEALAAASQLLVKKMRSPIAKVSIYSHEKEEEFGRKSMFANPNYIRKIGSEGTVAQVITRLIEEDKVGAKSDLARLLILHYYGGIYADVDLESLRPLPHFFFNRATFFIGAQRTDTVELGNAILGCARGSELLNHILSQVCDLRRVLSDAHCNGQAAISWELLRLVRQYTNKSRAGPVSDASLVATRWDAMDVIRRTGPGFLTRVIIKWLQDHYTVRTAKLEKRTALISEAYTSGPCCEATATFCSTDLSSICICPVDFFYPLRPSSALSHKGVERLGYINPHYSFAVHHWKRTWQKVHLEDDMTFCKNSNVNVN